MKIEFLIIIIAAPYGNDKLLTQSGIRGFYIATFKMRQHKTFVIWVPLMWNEAIT